MKINLPSFLAVLLIALGCQLTAFAQRGTMEFVKVDRVDKLAWTDGTNRFPVYTEVQLQTGADNSWRTVANVSGTNKVTLAKDARTTRYRIRHVYYFNGLSSSWCYKSTK